MIGYFTNIEGIRFSEGGPSGKNHHQKAWEGELPMPENNTAITWQGELPEPESFQNHSTTWQGELPMPE